MLICCAAAASMISRALRASARSDADGSVTLSSAATRSSLSFSSSVGSSSVARRRYSLINSSAFLVPRAGIEGPACQNLVRAKATIVVVKLISDYDTILTLQVQQSSVGDTAQKER